MSELVLYADYYGRRLVTKEGGAAEPLTLVLGDQLTASLHITERVAGELRELNPHVRTLRASLGNTLAPPDAGTFKLRGPLIAGAAPESDEISFDATAAQFSTALAGALASPVAETLRSTIGCWLFRLEDNSHAELAPFANLLHPVSFVRVRQFEENGIRWHEVRLIQTPLAFAGAYERVLPEPPSVSRIRAGAARADEFTAGANEVQSIRLPVAFEGTWFIRWNFRTSKVLGSQDDPDTTTAALNAMYTDGKKRFVVTNPEDEQAYVEFIGPLAEAPQPLMEVVPFSFAPGVITFTLDLERAACAAALRNIAIIEVPFEVELEIVDRADDLDDPAIPGRVVTLFQQLVKVTREQIWPELDALPQINWLRPPQPRDYNPLSPDQIRTGTGQSYVTVRGNGVARIFVCDHGLATADIAAIAVKENAPGGRFLANSIDFTATVDSDASVTISVPAGKPTPAANAWRIIIEARGPESVFAPHHHYITDIYELEGLIGQMLARIAGLEELYPQVTPGLLEAPGDLSAIEIPDREEVFLGGRWVPGKPLPGSRAGLLSPAIHDATLAQMQHALPGAAASFTHQVFENVALDEIIVPGGFGRRRTIIPPGGFAGSDGRGWYPVRQAGATNSFFPIALERELFGFYVNAQEWRAGGTFTLQFGLDLQLISEKTWAQFTLLIETGTVTSRATPATTALNLQDIVWQTGTPVLAQVIRFGETKRKHRFGCSFGRSADGLSMTASRLLYDVWQGGATPPPAADFALRARLAQFDTEDDVNPPHGIVAYALSDARAGIENT